ncbi:MAG TPA: AAA family ATPase, partial [Mycobacterium sp.]|nr:AAA family ATPase [Mycobacterium sp.]
MSSAIYGAAYGLYRDRGWTAPIKLRAATKWPPPSGFTGHDGAEPSGADMHAWAEDEPNGNIAIRLPADMMGIDTDNYEKNGGDKNGGAAIAEAEKRWGKLPYSPRSTSRADDPISGIRLYRIPAGVKLVEKLKFPELGLGGVETIQHHHRYAVCWPSIHDKTGQQYQWYGIDGGPLDAPPAVTDIPELPQKWLYALTEPAHNGTELDHDAACDVPQAITDGEPSPRVMGKLTAALTELYGPSCRHDEIRDHALGLLRCGKQGETGVKAALKALQEAFANVVGPDRPGGRAQALDEFRKFIYRKQPDGRWVISEKVARLLADNSYDDTAWAQPPPGAEQGETGDGEPVLADTLLSRSDLLRLPDPEPLIDGVLDQGTTALLYGKWGTLKSFIAIDWAACVGTGRSWQGRPTEQRRTLYVAAEGAYGYKGRIDAWEVGWHTKIHDGTLDILPRPVNLTNAADVGNLRALIEWGGYGFVILDTLARCMVGADENSAKDCGEVVDALRQLRECTLDGRGVVLGVHHTGKDGKTFRGSSVFEAGADTVYSTTQDGVATVLDREKRKDGAQLDTHRLKLDPIEGTGSGVISVHREVDKPQRAGSLLSTYVVHFDGVGASKAELRTVAEMPNATFHRALSDLLK